MMSFLIIYQAQLHEGFSIPLPGTVFSSYDWSIPILFLNQILTSHPGPREVEPCPEEDL